VEEFVRLGGEVLDVELELLRSRDRRSAPQQRNGVTGTVCRHAATVHPSVRRGLRGALRGALRGVHLWIIGRRRQCVPARSPHAVGLQETPVSQGRQQQGEVPRVRLVPVAPFRRCRAGCARCPRGSRTTASVEESCADVRAVWVGDSDTGLASNHELVLAAREGALEAERTEAAYVLSRLHRDRCRVDPGGSLPGSTRHRSCYQIVKIVGSGTDQFTLVADLDS